MAKIGCATLAQMLNRVATGKFNMNKKILELQKYTNSKKTLIYNAFANDSLGGTWIFRHLGNWESYANSSGISSVNGTYCSEAAGRAYASRVIPKINKAKELSFSTLFQFTYNSGGRGGTFMTGYIYIDLFDCIHIRNSYIDVDLIDGKSQRVISGYNAYHIGVSQRSISVYYTQKGIEIIVNGAKYTGTFNNKLNYKSNNISFACGLVTSADAHYLVRATLWAPGTIIAVF